MFKQLVVFAFLAVTVSAGPVYAENEQILAKCLGMSTALALPDQEVFAALLYSESEYTRTTFGIKSDEYNIVLRNNAELIGWGSGYVAGLLQNNGKAMLFNLFMQSCYNNKHDLRDKMLASIKTNHVK